AEMRVNLCVESAGTQSALMNDGRGVQQAGSNGTSGDGSQSCKQHMLAPLRNTSPTFVMGSFSELDGRDLQVHFLPDQKALADNYLSAAQETRPFVTEWLGDHRRIAGMNADLVELPDNGSEAFENGNLLLMPLAKTDTSLLFSSIQQLAHLMFPAFR